MNWMLFSAEALLLAAAGPLLMVESTPEIRSLPEMDRRRRILRGWTAAALVLAGVYLAFDRVAVSAGTRSLVVMILAVGLFLILLVAVGYPILHDAACATPRTSGDEDTSPPVLSVPWDTPVLLMLVASIVAFPLSPNDLGYRIKGTGIVVAGGVLYFLGRPRATRSFLLCAVAGSLTLFVQWGEPWQRALGAVGQLGVGVVGLVWCARLIVRMAAERAARDGGLRTSTQPGAT